MSSSGGEKKRNENGVNISSQPLEGKQKDGCVNCSLHTLLMSVIFLAQRATTCLRTRRHTAGSRKEASCVCVCERENIEWKSWRMVAITLTCCCLTTWILMNINTHIELYRTYIDKDFYRRQAQSIVSFHFLFCSIPLLNLLLHCAHRLFPAAWSSRRPTCKAVAGVGGNHKALLSYRETN